VNDHNAATCRNGDHYGQCSGATPAAVRLTRRSLPDRLRYLAGQLRQGTHWSAVAVALDTTADELEASIADADAYNKAMEDRDRASRAYAKEESG
jgi:hypothetical protein